MRTVIKVCEENRPVVLEIRAIPVKILIGEAISAGRGGRGPTRCVKSRGAGAGPPGPHKEPYYLLSSIHARKFPRQRVR